MFEIGTKVWFSDHGPEVPAVIVGFGDKDGELVYDVQVEGKAFLAWGRADQLRIR